MDCHNDNFTENETIPEKGLPFAYITGEGDIEHKISLAIELGLHRVIIIPHELMVGSMAESLQDINPRSDGMIVEVSGNDKSGASAKIALQFLQMSEGLNNHRPSNGVQILHEFQTTFLPSNPDLKIFKMEIVGEDQIGTDDSAHYMVINDKPIKITGAQIKEKTLIQLPLAEKDKELF